MPLHWPGDEVLQELFNTMLASGLLSSVKWSVKKLVKQHTKYTVATTGLHCTPYGVQLSHTWAAGVSDECPLN